MRFTRVILYRAGSCKACSAVIDRFTMASESYETIKPTIGLNDHF